MAKGKIAGLIAGAAALAGAAWAFDKYAQQKFQRSGVALTVHKALEYAPKHSAAEEMAILDERKGTPRTNAGLPGVVLKTGIASVYDDGNDDTSGTFGMTTYRFVPRDFSDALVKNTTILYVHGGGYVAGFDAFHVTYMTQLARKLGVTVLAPDYDPAPWGNAEKAYDQITALYTKYRDLNPDERVILMGDSAGGGLIFGLALSWAKRGITAPEGIIALSPWVDAALTNPQINAYADRDPMLKAESLRIDAREWADKWSMSDPRISPIKADLKVLRSSEVTVLVGTEEIFYPDVTDFASRLSEAGVKTRLHVGEKMLHVYPLQPIPEAKESWSQIEEAVVEATIK